MEKLCPVTLSLSHDLLRAVGRAARDASVAPSVLVMRLLAQILLGTGIEEARVRLALVTATGWADLQARLRTDGFCLRRSEGTLDLCRWPSGQVVLPLSALGESAAGLALRFGFDFPPDGRGPPSRAPPAAFHSRRRRAATLCAGDWAAGLSNGATDAVEAGLVAGLLAAPDQPETQPAPA